jgi:vancomycin resistance protein VanJ
MARVSRFPVGESVLLGIAVTVAWLGRLDLYAHPGLQALQFVPWPWLVMPGLALLIQVLRARKVLRFSLVVASFLVLLLGVFGFELHQRSATSAPTFRVFVLNADMCAGTFDGMVQAVLDADPDVALQVEVCGNAEYVAEKLRLHYSSVLLHGQFLVASRYPVTRVSPPPAPGLHIAYAAYTLSAPEGPIELVAVHPVSPRPFFRRLARTLLRPDDLPYALHFGERNAAVRRENLMEAAREATTHLGARAVLLGDFNSLPQDGLLRAAFAGYRDSFEVAGAGFGYTFPRPWPWLRLDRVYTSPALVPILHETRCTAVSDHCGVVVDLRAAE